MKLIHEAKHFKFPTAFGIKKGQAQEFHQQGFTFIVSVFHDFYLSGLYFSSTEIKY